MISKFKKKAMGVLSKIVRAEGKHELTIDLAMSAYFFALGIAGTVSTGSAVPLVIGGGIGLQCLTVRDKKKEIKHGHGTQDILINCITRLVEEYAKDCGPKKPNDIVRKLLEDLDKHHKRDKKPPKSRGKKRFKMPFFKSATDGAGA